MIDPPRTIVILLDIHFKLDSYHVLLSVQSIKKNFVFVASIESSFEQIFFWHIALILSWINMWWKITHVSWWQCLLFDSNDNEIYHASVLVLNWITEDKRRHFSFCHWVILINWDKKSSLLMKFALLGKYTSSSSMFWRQCYLSFRVIRK